MASDNWKEKYEEKAFELEEFQSSSQEYEAALETEIQQANDEKERLLKKLNQLQNAYKSLDQTASARAKDVDTQLLKFQLQVKELQAGRDADKERIRELEQMKDDLERQNRVLDAQATDTRDELDCLKEDYVMLKEEMEETEAEHLTEQQRLRDEIRDLKLEVKRANDMTPTASELGDKSPRVVAIAPEHRYIRSRTFASGHEPVSKPRPILHHSYSTSMTANEWSALREEPAPASRRTDSMMSAASLASDMGAIGSKVLKRMFTHANSTPELKVESMEEAFIATRDRSSSTYPRMTPSAGPMQRVSSGIIRAPKNRSQSVFQDSMDKRYYILLTAGDMFKKYRHGSRTRRMVWCSSTLESLMWGDKDKTDIRGALKTEDVSVITSGRAHQERMIFVVTKARTLELEAESVEQHRDWINALRFLLKNQRAKNELWSQVVADERQLSRKQMAFLRHSRLLTTGQIFDKWKRDSKTVRFISFSSNLDRIQWAEPGKNRNKVKGFILFKDICDVNSNVPEKAERLIIMGVRRNLVLDAPTLAVKQAWVDAVQFLITYANKLAFDFLEGPML